MVGSARDVVIIGAGVIGTAMAYVLSQERLKVAVLDPQPLGSGCTFHGTGLVWKLIWNDTTQYQLAMEGRDLLFALVPQIHAVSGIDPMLHVFDTIVPIFDAVDMLRLERDLATGDGDIIVEWLDHDDVLRLEPRIHPAVQRGALLRDSAQINGYWLALAQARAAELQGVEFLALKATGVATHGGRVTAVHHSAGTIPCGAVPASSMSSQGRGHHGISPRTQGGTGERYRSWDHQETTHGTSADL